MRPRLRTMLMLAGFLAVVLAASRARALDFDFDEWQGEAVRYAESQPFSFFIAACVFLVVGIFAKYQEARGAIVLGSFFLAALCTGVFVVSELSQQFLHNPPPRIEVAHEPTAPPPVAAEHRIDPTPLGGECHRNSDCGEGSLCAHVAGKHRCWRPCGPAGACEAGFACMLAAEQRTSVCVQ